MDKFCNNKIVCNLIENKENFGAAFTERVLELYCIINNLKVFVMSTK